MIELLIFLSLSFSLIFTISLSLFFLIENPFNQRRQTATEAAGVQGTTDKLDRKNTTGTLNRHES